MREVFRAERQSYKLDLALNGQYITELFSFPNHIDRPTQPEATGLRHLAFEVFNLNSCLSELEKKGLIAEEIRIDEHTGKRFTFFLDPDNLPIELNEK